MKYLLALALCATWLQAEVHWAAESRPQLAIILLDETSVADDHWSQITSDAAKVVTSLPNGAALAVIGIDAKGFDDDDVRIPIRKLPTSILATRIRRQWAREVAGLRVRGRPAKTDILNALRQAALLANLNAEFATTLFILSDMQENVSKSISLRGVHFPSGATALCLYVNSGDARNWASTEATWLSTLHEANVRITEQEFCPAASAVACLQRKVLSISGVIP